MYDILTGEYVCHYGEHAGPVRDVAWHATMPEIVTAGVCARGAHIYDTISSGTVYADRGRTTPTSVMNWRVSTATAPTTPNTTNRSSHRRFFEPVISVNGYHACINNGQMWVTVIE